jgi:Uncharacterised protein conserved in bacteria (DUF2336)
MKETFARAEGPARLVNGPSNPNRYSDAAAKFTSRKRSDVALATSANNGILIELDDRPGADMTARLLLALTALYAQRPSHTVEEQQQYIELALRLIDKVEAATRTAVGCILQRHPDAPAKVVERLGGRPSWQDGDLEGAPHSTQDQHPAGHRHFDGNPPFADRKCPSTPMPSDASAGWQLPPPCPPALPLANPPPQAEERREREGKAREGAFGEAFFAASPAERRRLLSLTACRDSDDDQATLVDSDRLHGKVDAAALDGRVGEFTREFAQLIDVPNSLCERILNDSSGEPMVVAAKAAGMPIAILQHVLLLVSASASYSVERVYDLSELYHGLDGRATRDLLAQWRTEAKLNHLAPGTEPNRAGLKRNVRCNAPVESLRSRFGALTERLQAVNARCDRGSVARRGLRSR